MPQPAIHGSSHHETSRPTKTCAPPWLLDSRDTTFSVFKPHVTPRNVIAEDKYLAGPRDCTLITNESSESRMDNETKSEIELILDRVNSINELDRGHLCQLRATLAGRFAIEKFEVTNSEWCQWIEKRGYENIRGVEYDAHRNRLIVKATQSVLHETSTEVISAWFRTVARELQNATSSKFQNVRSTC